MQDWWIVLAVVLGVLGVLALWGFWYIGRHFGPDAQAARARARFHEQRTSLHGEFFQAAAASGKPRGLRWVGCEWGDAVEFLRERRSGQVLALVSVTIRFEAVEGGDMEGVAAVGNLRNASAVFSFAQGRWTSSGRAVFNLNPDEAARHFGDQYERLVEPEPPTSPSSITEPPA